MLPLRGTSPGERLLTLGAALGLPGLTRFLVAWQLAANAASFTNDIAPTRGLHSVTKATLGSLGRGVAYVGMHGVILARSSGQSVWPIENREL